MENKYIINILRRQQRTDKFKIVDTFTREIFLKMKNESDK